MPMPEAKMYAMKRKVDGVILGYCQGWSWMIPEVSDDVLLVEVTTDGLPPIKPPKPI